MTVVSLFWKKNSRKFVISPIWRKKVFNWKVGQELSSEHRDCNDDKETVKGWIFLIRFRFHPQRRHPTASIMTPTTLVVLPDDLIVKILSFLPVISLVRFSCVNKSWKTIISDRTFVKLHLNRSSSTRNPPCALITHRSSFIFESITYTATGNLSVASQRWACCRSLLHATFDWKPVVHSFHRSLLPIQRRGMEWMLSYGWYLQWTHSSYNDQVFFHPWFFHPSWGALVSFIEPSNQDNISNIWPFKRFST